MEEKKIQDILARAYALLQGLRNNVANLSWVKETYVREYHTILDMIERIGIGVNDFRIPQSEVQPRITSISSISPKRTVYSEQKYVDKELLLTKLDGILGYFEITFSEEPRRIGFTLPDKQ